MRINVIDIETMYENNKFSAYCICMILGEKKIKIYGEDVVEKMIKFLEDNKVKTIIFAHNLTFDGSIIIEKIPKHVKMSGIFFRSSIYEITLKSKNMDVVLRCSYKLLPLPLKSIGELLNEKKWKKIEFPHEFAKKENLRYIGEHPKNNNIKNWNFEEEAKKYCMKDCEITKKNDRRNKKRNRWGSVKKM